MRTLTSKLADIQADVLLVGVDLAEVNVGVAITYEARQVGRIRFEHNRAGYDRFISWQEQMKGRVGARQVLVGMEPTNHYWQLLAAELERRGIAYRLVNPYTVKKHREGDQLDRAKNDQRDGFTIADLLRTGKFTFTQRQEGSYAELRGYSNRYHQLRRQIARTKIQLRQAVAQTFPELGEAFKDLTGQTAAAMLHNQASAHQIGQLSETAFLQAVRADYQGSRFQWQKLGQAYALAQSSVGLVETEALQLAIGGHLQLLTLLEAQLTTVCAALLDTFLALPEAKALLSLGIGAVSAALLLAEIGDPAAFTNARQLVKLAGIQPSPNQSGKKTNSPTPISRKGRPRLRTILYFACLRLVQTDVAFAAYYQHLQQRPQNPLSRIQALVVLMHKLLHIAWSLIRHQSTYDPALWRSARS